LYLYTKQEFPNGYNPELTTHLVAEAQGLRGKVLICQRSGAPSPCDAKNSKKNELISFF